MTRSSSAAALVINKLAISQIVLTYICPNRTIQTAPNANQFIIKVLLIYPSMSVPTLKNDSRDGVQVMAIGSF